MPNPPETSIPLRAVRPFPITETDSKESNGRQKCTRNPAGLNRTLRSEKRQEKPGTVLVYEYQMNVVSGFRSQYLGTVNVSEAMWNPYNSMLNRLV
jgi:hypothetical protein